MSRLVSILAAVPRSARRDLASCRAVKANNFFLFAALLIYGAVASGMEPASAKPFLLPLAFLMLFPLSADPLRKIPPARLGLWPLALHHRAALRLASLLLIPVPWFAAAALLVKTRRPVLASLPAKRMALWPGLTFGLTAVAIGHWPSLSAPARQQRWRFTGHRLFPAAVQGLTALTLAFAEHERGPRFLARAAAFYAGSLYLGGRNWEHAR